VCSTTLLYDSKTARLQSQLAKAWSRPSSWIAYLERSLDITMQSGKPNTLRAEAIASFVSHCQEIPEVRAVTVTFDNEVIQVRTFLTARSRPLRDRIYAQELQLMEGFPLLTFDFNVLPRPEAASSDDPSDLGLEGQICCYYRTD